MARVVDAARDNVKDPDAQRRATDRLERALEKLKRQRPPTPSDPARREEQ